VVYQLHEYGICLDTRELWLTGDVECDTAFEVLANLRLLESQGKGTVLLHSASPGGDWNYGIAIYDALRACACKTVVLAHAHAASMTSIIPQGADVRVIMPNTDVLIHYGTEIIGGNAQSVISTAKWSEVLRERMLAIYADRCYRGQWFRAKRWGRDRVKEWLRKEMDKKQECYMDAREAVEHGLFDGVLGDKGFETVEALRTV
jgi:ATP-dependent protease ClpP protease subunit